jgi:hypothetical protein
MRLHTGVAENSAYKVAGIHVRTLIKPLRERLDRAMEAFS